MERWQIRMLAQPSVQEVSSGGVTNTSIFANYTCQYGHNYNEEGDTLPKNYNKHKDVKVRVTLCSQDEK